MYKGIILLDEKSPFIQAPSILKNCPILPVNQFLDENDIDIAILNPNQIPKYYTRPFALYFDLKDTKNLSKGTYDYLIINIHQAFLNFTETYPEYWNEIRNSFRNIQYIK